MSFNRFGLFKTAAIALSLTASTVAQCSDSDSYCTYDHLQDDITKAFALFGTVLMTASAITTIMCCRSIYVSNQPTHVGVQNNPIFANDTSLERKHKKPQRTL